MFLHKLVKTLKVMKNQTIANFKYWLLALPALAIIFSCNYSKPQLTPDEIGHVQGKVNKLMNSIATDVSAKGPGVWLNYLQDTSYFFMADNGQLAFKDYKSATKFVQDTLVKSMPKVNLKWSNIRIDPLTDNIACVGAEYHEDVTDTAAKVSSLNGYFTATVVQVNDEWKLRNMHWSDISAKK
jgi:hypothetical protein